MALAAQATKKKSRSVTIWLNGQQRETLAELIQKAESAGPTEYITGLLGREAEKHELPWPVRKI